MYGGTIDAADQQVINVIENQIKEFGGLKGGADGIYSLFSVASDALLRYREAYDVTEGGGPIQGWASGVQTMYGGAAFSDDEAQQVEEFMNKHGGYILEKLEFIEGDGDDKTKQLGGGSAESAAFLIKEMTKYIDPRMVSIDAAVTFVIESIDLMNSKMEDLSRLTGILRLENTVPAIPLSVIGLPDIPTRLLVVILQGIFEVLRLVSLFGFPGSGILRSFSSICGGMLEAAKGDWKSALFTFIGVTNNTTLIIGSLGKVFVKVMNLINESTRNKLIYTSYESIKSLIAGFFIFMFTTFSPLPVKALVDTQLQLLLGQLGGIQAKQDALKAQLEEDPAIKGLYTVEFTNFKNIDKIDFGSLHRLQDLFIIPEFYCNNAVQNFIEQIKFIPPARIALEFMGLPTTDSLVKQSCINVSEEAKSDTGFEKALLEALAPRLRPVPLPIRTPDKKAADDAVQNAMNKKSAAPLAIMNKPAESKSPESKSPESQPAESKPPESKSAESKPAESKPPQKLVWNNVD